MSDRYSVSLGQRLRAARRQRGWSLGDVENQTDGEFKASVVGAYERGERAISVQRFARLSEVYGIPPGELLPVEQSESVVVDLEAIESGAGGDLVERYLAAIHLLRKIPGSREVRHADRSIIASLLQVAEHRPEGESTRPNR